MPAETLKTVRELNSSALNLSRTVVVLAVVVGAVVHPGLGTKYLGNKKTTTKKNLQEYR